MILYIVQKLKIMFSHRHREVIIRYFHILLAFVTPVKS